ncbi:MAG: phosphodiester glycosidase family protein [Candidatus Eremiobacteraeota bacterium]|nr:phosphodiester glycosidase family protein [Candidatus Eremiobacteraeota bacterium]
MRTILLLILCTVALQRAALAALPPAPSPGAPFPQIVSDAFTSEFVAPGISYAQYAMETKSGPVVIHIVNADLADPTVRVDTVLAGDSLVSAGETPSAMAARTGAVAGVNADYFDIGNTNAPLGVVVRGGHLVQSPNAHSALALTRDRHLIFSPLTFTATAEIGTIPLVLSGINEWPVHTGVSLITPAHGPLGAVPGLTVARVTPLDVDGAAVARYRIEEVRTADSTLPRGYWLAISPPATETLGAPVPGDVVTVSETSASGFTNFVAAVGGGPLLIHEKRRYFEPDAPAANEGRTRIPISAAALGADGKLMLLEVDGRQPFHSIGLTRDEFVSFLFAIGAVEAISFDGGGSSAIVARKLGERNASLRSSPSDGAERVVGDGLFVYSDAAYGPPARLAVYPEVIRAFPGASVPLTFATTDAAGHPVAQTGALRAHVSPGALGAVADQNRFTAGKTAAKGILHVVRGSLSTDIPVEIAQSAARIEITPRHANMKAGATERFEAQAFDRGGFRIALPEHLHWSTTSGRVTDSGVFTAANDNATLKVSVANSAGREDVTIGEHEEALQLGTQWHLVTVPAGGPGEVTFGVPCPVCITLAYDFTDTERDATMAGNRPMASRAIGLRMDVNGDGNNELLRISLLNAINERVYLTVGRVNWRNWQTKEVRFPASLAGPAQLHSIYVLNGMGSERVHVSGAVAVRNVRMILAGK